MVTATAIGVAVVAWRRGGSTKLFAGVAVGLVVLSAVASASYARNRDIIEDNILVVIAVRIAPDPGYLAWFEDHGMPVPAGRNLLGFRNSEPFGAWLEDDGVSTYARFLLTHPGYTLGRPLEDLAARLRPGSPFVGDDAPRVATGASLLAPDDIYGEVRPVLPDAVEDLLFGPNRTGVVLTAFVVAGGWILAGRRWRGRSSAPLVIVGLSFASMLVGWHGAASELERVAIVSAVGVRIGLVLLIAALVEAAVAGDGPDRSPASPATA